MASALSQLNIGVNLNWIYASTVTGFGTAQNQNVASYSQSLTNGTGAAGTANQLYIAQITLAASANTTLNFNTGLSDMFGNGIACARLKYLYIHNTNLTTSTSITVGNATNPLLLFSAATATISVRNNGIFFIGDGGATCVAVTGSSADSLKIVNADGSNAATVNLVAVGSTA